MIAQAPELRLATTDQVAAAHAIERPARAPRQIHHHLEFIVLHAERTTNRLPVPARTGRVGFSQIVFHAFNREKGTPALLRQDELKRGESQVWCGKSDAGRGGIHEIGVDYQE